MKKLLVAGITAAAFCSAAAFAADTPYKAVPAPVAIFNWTGFYIGGNLGWADPKESWTVVGQGFAGSDTTKGFLGGGQVGANWQVNQSFLLGIQGDIDAANITGSAKNAANFLNRCGFDGITNQSADCTSKGKLLSTLTARAGWLPTPNMLFYVKGGIAWQRFDFNVTNVFGTSGGCPGPHADYKTTRQTRSAGTVGGGVEARIMNNVTAFAEYDYANFGTKGVTMVNTSGDFCVPTFIANVSEKNENIAKFGVNVLFNTGGY